MGAVAHNPAFARKVGISQKVGREFDHFDDGGQVDDSWLWDDAQQMDDGGQPDDDVQVAEVAKPRHGRGGPRPRRIAREQLEMFAPDAPRATVYPDTRSGRDPIGVGPWPTKPYMDYKSFLGDLPRRDADRGTGRVEFVPDLKGVFGNPSRDAVDAVRRATEQTGKEAFMFGAPDVTSGLTLGEHNYVLPSSGYNKFARRYASPFFNVHTHPSGTMSPSVDDLRFHAGEGVPGTNHMLIEAMGGPDNRVMVGPHGVQIDDAMKYFPVNDQQGLNTWKDLNKQHGLNETDMTMGGALKDEWLARRGLPMYVDQAARPNFASGTPYSNTVQEMLPEYLKYLRSTNALPYNFKRGGYLDVAH